MKRLLLILTLLLFATTPADAFTWKDKHFRGLYYCIGSGSGYTWAAVLATDGRGNYLAGDVVGTRYGVSDVIETGGTYTVDRASGYLVLRFGSGYAEGMLVQKGKGVLLSNNVSLFTGSCWRDR